MSARWKIVYHIHLSAILQQHKQQLAHKLEASYLGTNMVDMSYRIHIYKRKSSVCVYVYKKSGWIASTPETAYEPILHSWFW